MEKQGFICSSGRLRSGLALLALTSLALAGAPHRAEALSLQGTAGNALVRNTVSVAYSDAHNTAQTAVTASVDITVNTVAVAPTLFNFDASATTDGTGAQQLYHAWVRTNSNGPGTVSLTGADGSPSNMTVSLTTPSGLSSLYLGSTIFDPSGNAGIIGTAQTIADTMEEWLETEASDGFTIQFPYLPAGLDDFVDQVVPELQRRGIFRKEYEGATLRENLGLPRPENRFFPKVQNDLAAP